MYLTLPTRDCAVCGEADVLLGSPRLPGPGVQRPVADDGGPSEHHGGAAHTEHRQQHLLQASAPLEPALLMQQHLLLRRLLSDMIR